MSSSVLKSISRGRVKTNNQQNRFRYLFLILIASGGAINLYGIKDVEARNKGIVIYSIGFFIYFIILFSLLHFNLR